MRLADIARADDEPLRADADTQRLRALGRDSFDEIPDTVLPAQHIQSCGRRFRIRSRFSGIGKLIEQPFDPGRSKEEKHLCRFVFLVAEPMLGPLGDIQVGPGSCYDPLPIFTVEGQLAGEDIEPFLLARLDMKRRPSSRRNDGLYEEILAVGSVTGRQISIFVSCSEDHLFRVAGVNYPDTAIRHFGKRSFPARRDGCCKQYTHSGMNGKNHRVGAARSPARRTRRGIHRHRRAEPQRRLHRRAPRVAPVRARTRTSYRVLGLNPVSAALSAVPACGQPLKAPVSPARYSTS